MANKKLNYVQRKKIAELEKKYDYVILLGERSNGKSYAVKSHAVQRAIDSGGEEQFIYLRRYEADVKDSLCVNYFADLPVDAMTKGKYSCIDVYRKGIYLANTDPDTGKIVERFKIGYCHALNLAERYKSLSFPKVKRVIYEEFISKEGRYLFGILEPDSLQHYISTIFRNNRGKVFLIGNKISRICPYFKKWCLTGVLKQASGTVDTYTFKDDSGTETKIGLYNTNSLNYNSGMFFGTISNNITKDSYEVDEQPHLPDSIGHYKVIYTVVVKFDEFMFLCRFLSHRKNCNAFTWYIEPKTTPIKKGSRVICPDFSEDIMWTIGFDPLTKEEKFVFNFLYDDKMCFSDNLTGTEFKNIFKNQLR